MGGQDISQKTLESNNDVFADIVNVLVFSGEQVVKAESLTDSQMFSQYKDSKNVLHNQERDVAKKWTNGDFCLSLFGFENQTKKEKSMPLRVMCYDGVAYRSQLLDDTAEFIEETQREKGGVSVCEFVQKMRNEGRSEGFSLGRSEGIFLQAKKSARIAISMGLTKEQAAKISGLSLAEVEEMES